MFCKKCGHERVNGEKFCPVCGTPFPVDEDTKDENFPAKNEASPLQENSEVQKPSEPVVQYCKKCGTKQVNGMKFCPVCGEPYLDENGKPYLKGRQKDIAEAKEKVKSTISDLSDKGKNIAGNIGEKISTATSEGQKQVKEKVMPQISQVVTQAKEIDWDEQAKNGKEKANAFFNDSAKTTKWAKITAVAATVLFFLINGFASIWLWYVILIIMLLIAFLPQKGQNKAEVAAKHKKIFIATACLAGCLIFLLASCGDRLARADLRRRTSKLPTTLVVLETDGRVHVAAQSVVYLMAFLFGYIKIDATLFAIIKEVGTG